LGVGTAVRLTAHSCCKPKGHSCLCKNEATTTRSGCSTPAAPQAAPRAWCCVPANCAAARWQWSI
jgi:hypothetical protein